MMITSHGRTPVLLLCARLAAIAMLGMMHPPLVTALLAFAAADVLTVALVLRRSGARRAHAGDPSAAALDAATDGLCVRAADATSEPLSCQEHPGDHPRDVSARCSPVAGRTGAAPDDPLPCAQILEALPLTVAVVNPHGLIECSSAPSAPGTDPLTHFAAAGPSLFACLEGASEPWQHALVDDILAVLRDAPKRERTISIPAAAGLRHYAVCVRAVLRDATRHAVVSATDLTVRTEAENNLRLAATALESLAEAVIVVDAQHSVFYANQAAHFIFPLDDATLAGRQFSFEPLAAHVDAEAAWASLTAPLASWHGEVVAECEDCEPVMAQMHVTRAPAHSNGHDHYIIVLSDHGRQRSLEQRMDYLASRDTLTGLPNRAYLERCIDERIDSEPRSGFSVLFLDVDGLKTVNDSLGHLVGDAVLQAVAARIGEHCGPDALVARFGGDEFAVVLETTASDSLAAVAEGLRGAFTEPMMVSGTEFFLTCSMGAARYPGDAATRGELLQLADATMYRAKHEAHGSWRLCEPGIRDVAEKRLAVANGMKQALLRDEFVLHYQPIVHTGTLAVTSFEALVRWQHPERGMIPPSEFIPVAEETGVISEIGDVVLQKAIAQIAHWRPLRPDLRVAVNVSARQLQHEGFVERVLTLLAEHDVPPDALRVEITESAVMQRPEHARNVLEELDAHGVRIALDDFGTGYSSLFYLRHLPIHTLKIDRAFLDGVPDDPSQRAMAHTIIQMASTFHLDVVGEGVETQAQHLFLREHGCRYAQGYLFGRPAPAEQATTLLNSPSARTPDPIRLRGHGRR